MKHFQELVKPVVSIKPLITKITGINDRMVTHAPSLKQALGSFWSAMPILLHTMLNLIFGAGEFITLTLIFPLRMYYAH